MSLTLSYDIQVSMQDGESCQFIDNTADYGINGNPSYASILAVRLYFGIYANEIAPTSLVATAPMTEYLEYQKTSFLNSTYDNKVIQSGQSYIPYVTSLTVLSGDTFVTTGRWAQYTSPATYLPTANQLPLTLLTSDLGITDTDVFPDGVYYLTYEVYTASGINTGGNVVANTQYMVKGVGTVVYDGNTYRTGEVFIAADTNAVTYTSAAVLVVLNSLVFRYFTFTFSIDTQLTTLILQLTQSCNCEEDLWYQIMVMRSKIDAIKSADIQNKTNAQLAQQMIMDIQVEIATIYNTRL